MRLFFCKEKCLYHTLNMMTSENNIFFGYCWCPKTKENDIKKTLIDFSTVSGFSTAQFQRISPTNSMTPPTSFKLSDFTGPFQVF